MKELQSQIEIDATPARVWQILTDFGAFPAWNPFVVEARGKPRVGEHVHIQVQPVGLPKLPLDAVVSVARPEQELHWTGSLPIPGLLAYDHYFKIEPCGEHRVRFVHGERFSGLLTGAMSRMLDTRAEPRYGEMNRAMKARAEGVSDQV